MARARIETIRRGAAAGHPFFAVFEDDLAPGAAPAAVRAAIRAALEQLPASADVLYLEACLEVQFVIMMIMMMLNSNNNS